MSMTGSCRTGVLKAFLGTWFVFTRPEDSEAQHLELLRIEQRIFDALEIP